MRALQSVPLSSISRRFTTACPGAAVLYSTHIITSTRPLTARCRTTQNHRSLSSTATKTSDKMAAAGTEGAWGAWQVEPAKFTKLVADSMKALYPEEIADRAWDNVGLLVGNHEQESSQKRPIVLVTNDLTYQVAMDAIRQGASVIVSYHPFIFSGLKSITDKDPQQSTLISLMQAGIAVYCPHTAVDAAPAGLNTWLADAVAGPHATTRSVAIPCKTAPESHAGAGYGALSTFTDGKSVAVAEILKRLAEKFGGLRHVMVASPVGADVRTTQVRSYGVCAGSGYDVLKSADVDLLVMGETSHHSALRAIQQGRTLVQVFHSNSERSYLQQVLRPALQEKLRAAVPEAAVVLSEYDKDPFTIVDVAEL
ncbi:hypothetical protein BB8028_0002g09290 [Beauveria bassiana]|uniref:Uncharacterized protein n=1 Tax=Beauveria bassiana TaxID=176275 RepID=A0A2S7Y3K3_BEABA|nr:hypothetical protein BB8028_0002g09290 [Beauveria bassiana]